MKYRSEMKSPRIYGYRAFEVYETELYVEGLHKPLTLALSGDVHMSNVDYRDGNDCKEYSWQRLVWFPLANAIFDEILHFPKDTGADFSVLLGDIVDFPSKKNFEELEKMKDPAFGPYLYVSGNHDYWFPYEGKEDAVRSYAAEIDAFAVDKTGKFPEITPEEAKDREGGFHAVDLGEIVVAGGNDITKKGKTALIKGLRALKKAGKPVLLCLHDPLYSATLAPDIRKAWGSPLQESLAGKDALTDEILSENSPVVGVLAGHVHFFHNDLLEGKIPQIVVSSQEKKLKTGTEAESRKFWSGMGVLKLLPLEKA